MSRYPNTAGFKGSLETGREGAEAVTPKLKTRHAEALLEGWRGILDVAIPFTPDSGDGAAIEAVTAGAKAIMSNFLASMTDAMAETSLSDEESGWWFSRINSANALMPRPIPGPAVYEAAVAFRYSAGPTPTPDDWGLIAALNAAPATLARLTPSPLRSRRSFKNVSTLSAPTWLPGQRLAQRREK